MQASFGLELSRCQSLKEEETPTCRHFGQCCLILFIRYLLTHFCMCQILKISINAENPFKMTQYVLTMCTHFLSKKLTLKMR